MQPRRALVLCGALATMILALTGGKAVYDATKPSADPSRLELSAGPDLAAADAQDYLAAATFSPDHRSVRLSLRAPPGAVVAFDSLLVIANPTATPRAATLTMTLGASLGSGSYAAVLRDADGQYVASVDSSASAGDARSRVLEVPAHDARAIGFTYRALSTAPDSGALLNADVGLRD